MKVIGYSATATLVASAAFSQSFYVGGSFGSPEGEFDYFDPDEYSEVSVFSGVRFELGTSGPFFVGTELELSKISDFTNVFDESGARDKTESRQIELHAGYSFGKFNVFGFIGRGRLGVYSDYIDEDVSYNTYGAGAEYDITDSIMLRLEYEMSDMSFVTTCSAFESVEIEKLKLGVAYQF